MDLIEAMEEEMERAAPAQPLPAQKRPNGPAAAAVAAGASDTASWDFVLQQAAFVQSRLKALWAAKHRADAANSHSNNSAVHVPFCWVLSKVSCAVMYVRMSCIP